MNIVFLGSGIGSGHVIHAASLFFALKRAGMAAQLTLLSDSDYCRLIEPYFECIRFKMQPQYFLKRDRETELYLLLKQLDIDILIVYGIWMPLLPILDEFTFKKIILFRQYEDWWFHLATRAYGDLDFERQQYDLTVSIEPNFLREGWVSINPLMIRNKEEILTREHARRALGAVEGRKLCVLAHNGLEGELEAIEAQLNGAPGGKMGVEPGCMPGYTIEKLHQEYQLIVTSNRFHKSFFPLASYFNGIDMLIGGAGYNLFYESRFYGLKACFFPQKRKNEDQAWRIRMNSQLSFEQNGADQLAAILHNL